LHRLKDRPTAGFLLQTATPPGLWDLCDYFRSNPKSTMIMVGWYIRSDWQTGG